MGTAVAPDTVNEAQLSSELGGVVLHGVDNGDGTVTLTAPTVDDATLVAAVSAHVPDPDYGLRVQQVRLRQVATLRQWAEQAETVANQSGNVTQAQLKVVIGRLGQLCNGLADLIVTLDYDTE